MPLLLLGFVICVICVIGGSSSLPSPLRRASTHPTTTRPSNRDPSARGNPGSFATARILCPGRSRLSPGTRFHREVVFNVRTTRPAPLGSRPRTKYGDHGLASNSDLDGPRPDADSLAKPPVADALTRRVRPVLAG